MPNSRSNTEAVFGTDSLEMNGKNLSQETEQEGSEVFRKERLG